MRAAHDDFSEEQSVLHCFPLASSLCTPSLFEAMRTPSNSPKGMVALGDPDHQSFRIWRLLEGMAVDCGTPLEETRGRPK